MNRTRMLILATAALALSVVVTFMTYRMLRNRLQPPEEMTTIVVATEKIALGTRLTEADVHATPWPKAVALEGSYKDAKQLVGRGVIVPISANEPIIEAKLAPKEGGAGLTSTIPEGMRAMSVKVNDVIGVAGFVIPGTRVDVILSGSPDRSGQVDVAKVILENVQVLAAGQNIDQDVNGKPLNVQVVTLLVSPEDSQKLALAGVDNRIQLALRNPLDLASTNPTAVQRVSLYGGVTTGSSPAVAATSAPALVATMPVIRRTAPISITPPAVAPVPPPPAPPQPRIMEVQLIQGNTSQIVKFTQTPVVR